MARKTKAIETPFQCEWVLWGAYKDSPQKWLKISGGNYFEVLRQHRQRRKEPAWDDLVWLPKGTPPPSKN